MAAVATLLSLSLAACVPDLQPAYFCAPDVTAPFAEAPAGLVTAQTLQLVEFYVSLGGTWDAQMQCPDGSPNSGPVTVSMQTDPIEAMRVIVGADLTQQGYDCRNEGAVLGGGQITLTGTSIGGLSGEPGTLDGRFAAIGRIVFSFDPSYDPGLDSVEGLMDIRQDHTMFNVISFAQIPTRNSDGSYSQAGYTCGLNLVARK